MLVDLEFTPKYLPEQVNVKTCEMNDLGLFILRANYNIINHHTGEIDTTPYETLFVRYKKGVYGTAGDNFDHSINQLTTSKVLDNPFSNDGFWSYGVADTVEQILAHHPDYETTPIDNFVLAITMIQKRYEPHRNGWRWKEWGSYIGIKAPQAEYLHDEPEIEEVLVYQFYQVEPKEAPQA